MSVIETIECFRGRGGSADYDKTTYTRQWAVITNNARDTAYTILAEAELPVLGETYVITGLLGDDFEELDPGEVREEDLMEEDDGAVLVKLDPVQDEESQYIWWVTGEYTTAAQDVDPIDQPPKKSWRLVKYKKAIYKDKDDAVIVNSTGDPFLPPREVEKHFWRLTYTCNQDVFDVNVMDKYVDAVNSEEFKAWPAGQVRVFDISGDEEYKKDGVTKYWKATYVIDFNEQGFELEILDKGPRYWDGGSYGSGSIIDFTAPGTGNFRETLLNGDGDILPDGDDPVFITFDINHRENLNDLGIGAID